MWQTCSSRVISTMDHQNQKPCNPTKALWTLATWLVGGGLEYIPLPCCYGVSGVGMVAFTKRCQSGQCSSFYDTLWNVMGPFNSFQPFGSVWFLFWSILKIGMLGQLLGLCHPEVPLHMNDRNLREPSRYREESECISDSKAIGNSQRINSTQNDMTSLKLPQLLAPLEKKLSACCCLR